MYIIGVFTEKSYSKQLNLNAACFLKVKVKNSHSLVVVGAVGVRGLLILGTASDSLLSLPSPSLIRKRYEFTAGLTEKGFH